MIDQTVTNLETPLFVAQMRRDRYRVWRSQVETFKTVQGARAELEHVEDATWQAHFCANEDAFSAVVSELAKAGD